jgi:hypothetical protein
MTGLWLFPNVACTIGSTSDVSLEKILSTSKKVIENPKKSLSIRKVVHIKCLKIPINIDKILEELTSRNLLKVLKNTLFWSDTPFGVMYQFTKHLVQL